MYLIFDFDGTLVNSFNCVMEKTMLLADAFNFRKPDRSEIESLRDLSSREIIKSLNIPFYKIPRLIAAFRKELQAEIPRLPPVTHIQGVLEKLFESGHVLGILTSNSVDNASNWLELHQLRHYFNFIHHESRYFSKKYLLKKTLQKYKIDKTGTFYIGDETRDLDAAAQNEVQAIAVTWGYNSEKILRQHRPSFVAEKPEDLLKICGLRK